MSARAAFKKRKQMPCVPFSFTMRTLTMTTALPIRMVSAIFTICLFALGDTSVPAQSPDVEHFTVEGRQYELDGYNRVFDSASPLGRMRAALFAEYLTDSDEGRNRVIAADSTDPSSIWSHLTKYEKSTFVAITYALHCVEFDGTARLSDWVSRLDRLHGKNSFYGHSLASSEAYRLWVRLSPESLELLRNDDRLEGRLRNVCTDKTYGTGGIGSTHTAAYCPQIDRFDGSTKFRQGTGHYGLQFNFHDCSDCAEIDVDYSDVCSFTEGNSNVLDDCWFLGRNHIEHLIREYGTGSGLRWAP